MTEFGKSIDWIAWLPWAVFGLVASLVWLALDYWSRRRPAWDVRLSALRHAADADESRREHGDGDARRDRADLAGRLSSPENWGARQVRQLADVLRAGVPGFLRRSSNGNEAGPTGLERRIAMAGWRGESAAQRFIGLRFVAFLIGLAAVAYVVSATTRFEDRTWAVAAAVGVAMASAPDAWLTLRARRRQQALERELPDALDLLVVCVEAGQGLDHALRRIAELLARSHAVVADELDVCVRQLQIGRSRAQVLRDLGERNASDSLRGLAAMLVQADRFGVSIGTALRSQSESLRTRRRQRVEEQAAGISVKLVFPLVLFTFPALLAVLVGPAALHLVRDLFPMLGR